MPRCRETSPTAQWAVLLLHFADDHLVSGTTHEGRNIESEQFVDKVSSSCAIPCSNQQKVILPERDASDLFTGAISADWPKDLANASISLGGGPCRRSTTAIG